MRNSFGRNGRGPLRFALLVMGASGICAQIVLLREILVTFLGNELSIGLVLANWLVTEAAGAFLAGRGAERVKNRRAAFAGITAAFSLTFPAAVAAARLLNRFTGAAAGEGAGIVTIFLASFLVLLPVSLLHGALFTIGCRIYPESGHSKAPGAGGIGRVYVLETLGTLLGGLALTFLLLPRLSSPAIAILISALNLLAAGGLLASSGGRGLRRAGWAAAAAAALAGWFLLSSGAGRADFALAARRWPGQELLFYRDSIYGNVAVTSREDQYNFYSDGLPLITTPVPDIIRAEEFAHLPLLSHPSPRRVLVISGGAGGLIGEILKHEVERVDYVELDPLVLETVGRFPTPLTEAELESPRLRTIFADGRIFIATAAEEYDVILVGISDLSSLQSNRLFSREFFSLAAARLRPGGILAFQLPGSLTYLGREMKNLNAAVLNSLGEVFPAVRTIPGDGANLHLASPSPGPEEIAASLLAERMEERRLDLKLLTPGYLEYRLAPRWSRWFEESMEGATGRLNLDFRPAGVFFSLAYWSALFTPALAGFFLFLERISLAGLAAAAAGAGICYLVFLRLVRRPRKAAVPVCVVSTGFTGMILDLVLIFAFQVLYGYVFHWVGLLVTAFMTGVLAGSAAMTSLLDRLRRDRSCLLALEGALALLCLLTAALLAAFDPRLVRPALFPLVKAVFLALSFVSGALVGVEFPLANKIHLQSSPRLASTAGLLYAGDLMGGWLGGIVGAVALLPVLGLPRTCLLLALVKLISLAGLLFAGGGSAAGGKSVPERGCRALSRAVPMIK